MGWFFAFQVVFVAILVALLSYHYGNWRKQNKLVTIIHYFAWYIPALIIATLPVDVGMTYYEECTLTTQLIPSGGSHNVSSTSCQVPSIDVSKRNLTIFWHVVYWASQFLTWLLLPMIQSYAKAGEFTVALKLKAALYDNLFYYTSYLLLFVVMLTYLLAKKAVAFHPGSIRVLVITASNTWGLFLVIIFLGYGLVELPRLLWIAGTPRNDLRRAYFQLSKRKTEQLEEFEFFQQMVHKVKSLDDTFPLNHPLRPCMHIIVKKSRTFEASLKEHFEDISLESRVIGPSQATPRDDLPVLKMTELAQLHKMLKAAHHRAQRAQALWEDAVYEASWLEDIDINTHSPTRVFQRGFIPAALAGENSGLHKTDVTRQVNYCACLTALLPRLEWYWKCAIRPHLLRLCSCLLSIATILVVWSECTFFIRSPTLSLVALTLKTHALHNNYFLVQLWCFAVLGYLSFAVYLTVFRLRIFNYFRLVRHHHTDENSLIFSGMLLCRLTPPLCINFLGLAHMDSHLTPHSFTHNQSGVATSKIISSGTTLATAVSHMPTALPVPSDAVETAFTKFMGHLDVIPFIASGFNIYFPILVVVLCVFTYFRIGVRLLNCLGIPQLLDTPGAASDDSMHLTEDAIQDGQLLLRKERIQGRAEGRHVGKANRVRRTGQMRTGGHLGGKYSHSSYQEDSESLLSKEEQQNNSEEEEEECVDFSNLRTPVEYSEQLIADQFRFNIPPKQATRPSQGFDMDPIPPATYSQRRREVTQSNYFLSKAKHFVFSKLGL